LCLIHEVTYGSNEPFRLIVTGQSHLVAVFAGGIFLALLLNHLLMMFFDRVVIHAERVLVPIVHHDFY
jgi:hypothetical protein